MGSDQAPWLDVPAAKGEFFSILRTTSRSQVGTMTIPSGQEAGPAEIHRGSDQIIYVIDGAALIRVWSRGEDTGPDERTCGPGSLVVVPAGTKHWVKSTGQEPLFFLTLYGPPAY